MSNLWKTAVERHGFDVGLEETPGSQPGYLVTARARQGHPSYSPEHGSLAAYAHVEERPDPDDPGGYVHHIHMIESNPHYKGQGAARAVLEHVLHRADHDNGVSHGGFTPEGAGLWQSVTGEEVEPTRKADRNNRRQWRYA